MEDGPYQLDLKDVSERRPGRRAGPLVHGEIGHSKAIADDLLVGRTHQGKLTNVVQAKTDRKFSRSERSHRADRFRSNALQPRKEPTSAQKDHAKCPAQHIPGSPTSTDGSTAARRPTNACSTSTRLAQTPLETIRPSGAFRWPPGGCTEAATAKTPAFKTRRACGAPRPTSRAPAATSSDESITNQLNDKRRQTRI